jgi:hypothetical protein
VRTIVFRDATAGILDGNRFCHSRPSPPPSGAPTRAPEGQNVAYEGHSSLETD